MVLSASGIAEVLVVDDNSPDGTGRAADEMAKANPRVHVLHRSGKMGLGSAYIEGFRYAIEKGYDYIFEMDADFSHDPAEIPNFLEAAKDYDVVIGSRYIDGIRILNWPLKRLMLSYFASVYARTITGLKLYDTTGGYKCFRREVLDKAGPLPHPFGRVLVPDRDELPLPEEGVQVKRDTHNIRRQDAWHFQDEQGDNTGGAGRGLASED